MTEPKTVNLALMDLVRIDRTIFQLKLNLESMVRLLENSEHTVIVKHSKEIIEKSNKRLDEIHSLYPWNKS